MSTYPAPHIIPPQPNHSHTHTLILLHGTSTSGPEFASSLLSTSFSISATTVPSTKITTLQQLLPGVRWVFPTGKTRFVTVLGREANAWFNIHDFKDRRIGEEESVEGLKESTLYLSNLIQDEVEVLNKLHGGDKGSERVIVGGFSQGAAMTSILLLSNELSRLGIELGGWVLMSGWLPFRAQISAAFSSPVSAPRNLVVASNYICDLLGLPGRQSLNQESIEGGGESVFISHGSHDQKMLLEWGQGMRDVLVETGREVEMKVFEVGHWWCEGSLRGLVEWLRKI